jgi:glucosamine 6-phosphate synthetase-like amidotransferase/phosphosugar isomerase protein
MHFMVQYKSLDKCSLLREYMCVRIIANNLWLQTQEEKNKNKTPLEKQCDPNEKGIERKRDVCAKQKEIIMVLFSTSYHAAMNNACR